MTLILEASERFLKASDKIFIPISDNSRVEILSVVIINSSFPYMYGF